MDAIDDVSYRPAQLMFMPTRSRDQEYLTWRNNGAPVDFEAILADWPHDWRNYENLPHSAQRGPERVRADRAENPLNKKGLIGAFCRTYSIPEAIEEFLPGIYVPTETPSGKPRYTYAHGTTASGAVIEDDGLFLYSHHGSDPCSNMLVNAFDLVRIHAFGKHDEGKDLSDATAAQYPSYREMMRFIEQDDKTKKTLLEEQLDLDAMFDDLSEGDELGQSLRQTYEHDTAAIDAEIERLLGSDDLPGLPPWPGRTKPPKPANGWSKTLDPDTSGVPKANLPNIGLIISNDARLYGLVSRNRFSQQICARREIRSKLPLVPELEVPDKENGLRWTDEHDDSLRMIMESPSGKGRGGYGMAKVSDRDINSAVRLVARKWEYHPVLEYLIALRWDRIPRVEQLWVQYVGAPGHAVPSSLRTELPHRSHLPGVLPRPQVRLHPDSVRRRGHSEEHIPEGPVRR